MTEFGGQLHGRTMPLLIADYVDLHPHSLPNLGGNSKPSIFYKDGKWRQFTFPSPSSGNSPLSSTLPVSAQTQDGTANQILVSAYVLFP